MWFTGDRYTKKGHEVLVNTIQAYKDEIKDILGTDVKYKKAIERFDESDSA